MVIRRLGLKMTLLAFPCMCLAVVIMVMMFPRLYVSEYYRPLYRGVSLDSNLRKNILLWLLFRSIALPRGEV